MASSSDASSREHLTTTIATPVFVQRLTGRLRADSLTRNSISIVGTSAINAGLGYIYWTVAARLMPAATVGLGSAMVSAMVIMSLMIHMGPGGGLISRLPIRTSRQEWLLTFLTAQFFSVAATLLLVVAALFPLALLLVPLRPLGTDPVLAGWFILGALGWTCSGLMDYTFIGERRSDLMFLRNTVSSSVKLLALIAVAVFAARPGATGIVATWSLSGLVGAAFGLYLCHRRIHRLGRLPHAGTTRRGALRGELAPLAGPSLGNHAVSVGGLIPTYLLPIVVTARLSTQQNAYFYVTWMVGSAIFMISPAVSAAIFAEGSHDGSRLRELSGNSLRIIMAVVIPATLVIGAAGTFILDIFGARYAAEGYGLLIVLLLSSFPDAVTNIAVSVLRVHRRFGQAAALNGLMAVIAVGGAWIAAPHLGIVGAGVAWLVAQTVGAVVVAARRRELWSPGGIAPDQGSSTAAISHPEPPAVGPDTPGPAPAKPTSEGVR